MIFKRIINAVFGAANAPRRYAQLFSGIHRVRPKHILEIGTWTGSRAAQMIAAAKEFNPAQDIHYYGLDLFEEFTENVMSAELSKRPPAMAEVERRLAATGAHIHLYRGDTQKTLPCLAPTLPLMDFIFIDGGHSRETVLSDWRYACTLLSPRGVLIFDDYWVNRTDAGAKPTVDSIDRGTFFVELLPTVDCVRHPGFGELRIQFAEVRHRPSG